MPHANVLPRGAVTRVAATLCPSSLCALRGWGLCAQGLGSLRPTSLGPLVSRAPQAPRGCPPSAQRAYPCVTTLASLLSRTRASCLLRWRCKGLPGTAVPLKAAQLFDPQDAAKASHAFRRAPSARPRAPASDAPPLLPPPRLSHGAVHTSVKKFASGRRPRGRGEEGPMVHRLPPPRPPRRTYSSRNA